MTPNREIFSHAGLAAIAFLVAVFCGSQAFAAGAGPEGAVILTVTGNITQTNRPAMDPFHDGLFKNQDKTFTRAYAFDRAMLQRLPQVDITADARKFPAPLRLRGPLLKDVLKIAGAGARDIMIYALDGYGVALPVKLQKAKDWVLALEIAGKPLAIGGLGPLWLVYDTGPGKASNDEEARWVWSVFHIAVE